MIASITTTYITVHIMVMIVMMAVKPNVLGDLVAPQPHKCGVIRERFRSTGTTNMLINAEHFFGISHNDMQIVGNHNHRAV